MSNLNLSSITGAASSTSTGGLSKTLTPMVGVAYVDFLTPAGTSITSGGKAQHISSTITEEYSGWARGTHIFQFNDANFLFSTLVPLMLQPQPFLAFVIGIQTDGTGYARPAEVHWVVDYSIDPSPVIGTHLLRIESADLLYAMNRYQKTATRKGVVSDILKTIGAENGIPVLTETTSEAIQYIQTFQTDYEFITGRIIPRAISSQGRGDFRIQAKQNTIIFGPLDYPGRQSTTWTVPYGTANTIVRELRVTDISQLSLAQGGSGVRAVVINPYTTTDTNRLSQPQSALSFGTVSPTTLTAPTPSGSSPVTDAFLNIITTSTYDLAEATDLAQNVYARKRAELYVLSFIVDGFVGFRIGDYIVLVTPETVYGGGYFIKKLGFKIESGHVMCHMTAARGELLTLPSSSSTVAVSNPSTSVATPVPAAASAGSAPANPSSGAPVLFPG